MNHVVARRIEVPADPATVWLALTDAGELRRWFGADLELVPTSGGAVRATWPDGARSVGSVELADEPHRLVFRWRRIDGIGFAARVGLASRVAFDLRATGGGTAITVTEEPVELASVVSGP